MLLLTTSSVRNKVQRARRNKYSIEIDGLLAEAVEAHREEGKDATSHHFIRSKQSTKGQPKIVIHHSSSPTSTQKSSSRFDLRVRP